MTQIKHYELGELADVTKLAGFEFTKYIKYNNYGEIIALRALNLRHGELDLTDIKRIDRSVSELLPRSKLYINDILLTYTGNGYGDCAIIEENDKYHLAPNICKIAPNVEKVVPYYLYSYIRTNEFYKIMSSHMTGSSQPTIPMKTIRVLPIPLPPIVVQEKIAEVAYCINEKIRKNNAINKNLLQQAIALYEHFLQEAEWPTATILDVAKKVAMGPFGSNIKISTFVPEGVPIISGNHLRGYFLEEPEFNYITEEHAERLKNSIVFPHDLIFTHAGNIGQVALIPDECKYDRYVLSQRQFYLRCDETKVVPEFLLLFFHSALGQHELLSYANQTGVPSIAQPVSNLKKIPFKCPPMQEQLKWQEQVHPLLSRYLNNRLENERLSSLRDTLLPKLMSGELDVSNIDF